MNTSEYKLLSAWVVQNPVKNLRWSPGFRNLTTFPVIALSFPRKESKHLFLLKCLKQKIIAKHQVVAASDGIRHTRKRELRTLSLKTIKRTLKEGRDSFSEFYGIGKQSIWFFKLKLFLTWFIFKCFQRLITLYFSYL